MDGTHLFDKLIRSFESAYDIERDFTVLDNSYDAHAYMDVMNARYVLIKKAELWRANNFEHIFVKMTDEFNSADIAKLRREIEEYIEPKLVRGNEKYPPQDHMYTYVTFMFIVSNRVEQDALRSLKAFRYFKNYLLSLRGYCEARVLVFDIEAEEIYGNKAAKDLVKGYSTKEVWR